MPKPRVSIIIPTYCPTVMVEEHFKRCLKLVRENTPPTLYQLIVIEQGKPVSLAFHAEQYRHFEEPIGFARAVNEGLALVDTEYACVLSNDVFVGPRWLEDLISEFESVPNMGMLAPMDDDHKPGCQCPWCLYKGPDTIFVGWHWGACMLMAGERARLNPFDEDAFNWRYCDQDMSIRLHQAGLMVARTSKVLVHHVSEATWQSVRQRKGLEAIEAAEKQEMIRRYGVSTYREVTGGLVTPVGKDGAEGSQSTGAGQASRPLFSICHTSARPDKWREIYEAWIKAAVHPENVEYVLCVDQRWGFDATDLDLEDGGYGSGRGSSFKCVWNEGRRCYVDGVNTAARASTGSLLIVNADDQWPCEGWDAKLLQAVPVTDIRGGVESLELVVEVSTGTPDEHNRGILVMPILSRARYEAQGFEVFYHEYESMYADNDFCEHARKDDVIIDARHLMFPHKHPINRQAETDEAYRAQNRPEAYALGKAIFERRRRAGFAPLPEPEVNADSPAQRTIALCLTGENFRGEWFDGFLNLYDHLVTLGFGIYRLRAYNSNVYVTREEVRQIVMSGDPRPELLLWLDDDNILRPEQFDRLLYDLDARPDVDGVTAWAWIYDEECKRFMVSCGDWAPDHLRWHPFDARTFPAETECRPVEATGFPCFLMRYSALEKAGHRPFLPLISDQLTHGILGEDFAFCLAAEKGGAKFLVDPRVRVAHLKYRDTIPQFLEGEGPVAKEPKIAVMMRVKNEARWIDRVVKAVLPLGPVYVLDDGSTDGTEAIAFDAGAKVLTSPFRGEALDERRDKNWLLDTVVDEEKPDWILCIDGDEELEPRGVEKIRQALQNPQADVFALRFCHLWDRPDQVRVDRWYSSFVRLSLFRPLPHLRFKSLYEETGVNCHSGLHTGNAPLPGDPYSPRSTTGVLNVFLLHYGSMIKETRIRKYEYYNRIDPDNEIEDRYRHVAQGDLPELPRTAKFKYAGPVELRMLPESMLRRPLVEVNESVESSAAD